MIRAGKVEAAELPQNPCCIRSAERDGDKLRIVVSGEFRSSGMCAECCDFVSWYTARGDAFVVFED